MTKRDIFFELIEGFGDLAASRKGKRRRKVESSKWDLRAATRPKDILLAEHLPIGAEPNSTSE
ncbi:MULTISPECIES: hypothetical protein [unclassified Pseudomonas]|uniref:hypothetical protein n=1 Tax=unclassified Pseudomonas TaxID=196821 RepID=UPI00210CC421|nr:MULTISPECIES: hypothetical protein [unclassified Pseudomonas]